MCCIYGTLDTQDTQDMCCIYGTLDTQDTYKATEGLPYLWHKLSPSPIKKAV